MSEDQLLKVLYLATQMANIDGAGHPLEKKLIKIIFNVLQVKVERFKEIYGDLSYESALESMTTDRDKGVLIKVLVLVGCADGELQEPEKNFIMNTMEQLGVSPQEHPLFQGGEGVEIKAIRHNIKDFLEQIKREATA